MKYLVFLCLTSTIICIKILDFEVEKNYLSKFYIKIEIQNFQKFGDSNFEHGLFSSLKKAAKLSVLKSQIIDIKSQREDR